MTDDRMEDAYRVLQIDPIAHQVVIRAAYLALARRYHPDGDAPDPVRMAALNHAYDLLRDEQRRRLYDAQRAVFGQQRTGGVSTPVGPGPATNAREGSARGAVESRGGASAPPGPGPGGFFSRARPQAADTASSTLDFGRYAGWTLRDVVRHDPDYLRWLSRHSSGLRYRNEIQRLLPDDAELARERKGAARY